MRTPSLFLRGASIRAAVLPGSVLLTALAVSAYGGQSGAGDAIADRVLGQADFVTGAPNFIDGRGLTEAAAIAVDRSVVPNRLYVADRFNNRVLAWRDAEGFANAQAADLVIGQPSFHSRDCDHGGLGPRSLCLERGFAGGLAVDGAGNLYVADSGNDRVLEYDAPFATDSVADRVFGQPDLSSRSEDPTSPNALVDPGQLAVDPAGNLFVAETNRVREFDRPLATDTLADRVFGSPGPDGTCPPGRTCMIWIGGIAVDPEGNLFISDFFKQWVVGYRSPTTTDDVPDLVIGRHSPTAGRRGCEALPISAETLCDPRQLATDAAGNLYVADREHHRVLVFDAPFSTDTIADHLLGGGRDATFTSFRSGCGGSLPAEDLLCLPSALAVDALGNVFVYDLSASRVLRYDRPFAGGDREPDGVLGQVDFLHWQGNLIDGRGLAFPSGLAIDRSVSPNRLYVLDTRNERVLGWRDAQGFANGAAADLVLGQPDFLTVDCNTGGLSAASLCPAFEAGSQRSGLAVDAHGNLFVADTLNDRVLEYDTPFERAVSPRSADRVYGQADFVSRGCNHGGIGAGTLCGPVGVAVDGAGNLFIADTGANRVVVYRDALRETRRADRVLGQKGSFRTSGCPAKIDAESFCFPQDVAVDGRGSLFVADSLRGRVLRFPKAGAVGAPERADLVLGTHGHFDVPGCDTRHLRADSLCRPDALTVDPQGGLWVADVFLRRVTHFRAAGLYLAFDPAEGLGRPDTPEAPRADNLLTPFGLAVDDDGNVYVADADNHRVLAYDQP